MRSTSSLLGASIFECREAAQEGGLGVCTQARSHEIGRLGDHERRQYELEVGAGQGGA